MHPGPQYSKTFPVPASAFCPLCTHPCLELGVAGGFSLPTADGSRVAVCASCWVMVKNEAIPPVAN